MTYINNCMELLYTIIEITALVMTGTAYRPKAKSVSVVCAGFRWLSLSRKTGHPPSSQDIGRSAAGCQRADSVCRSSSHRTERGTSPCPCTVDIP